IRIVGQAGRLKLNPRGHARTNPGSLGMTHGPAARAHQWPCPGYNASHLQCTGNAMKTTTIPSLRVSPDLRKQAEIVLEEGETLSAFVLDAVTRSIESRKVRQEFIARGLASAAQGRKSGRYLSSDRVIATLGRRLAKAKKRAA